MGWEEDDEIVGEQAEAVHEAAFDGDLEKLKLLLDAQPELIHAKGSWDSSPLHTAAKAGQAEVALFLIERGADVNRRDSLHSQTPLFEAVEMNRYKSSPADALACT